VFKFALVLLLMSTSQTASALSYTMEITGQEIQQRVTAMMPIQVTKPPITVVFLDPKVRLLKDSDEVAVSSPLKSAQIW
jgi:hypothetical protein